MLCVSHINLVDQCMMGATCLRPLKKFSSYQQNFGLLGRFASVVVPNSFTNLARVRDDQSFVSKSFFYNHFPHLINKFPRVTLQMLLVVGVVTKLTQIYRFFFFHLFDVWEYDIYGKTVRNFLHPRLPLDNIAITLY